MTAIIVPVPEPPTPVEPAIVAALRGQIARGATDAVLIRMVGSVAGYDRLAREFGLRPVAHRQPASLGKPLTAARAVAPARVPSALDAAKAAVKPVSAKSSIEPGTMSSAVPPIPEGKNVRRTSQRQPGPSDSEASLLRDIARLRRDLNRRLARLNGGAS